MEIWDGNDRYPSPFPHASQGIEDGYKKTFLTSGTALTCSSVGLQPLAATAKSVEFHQGQKSCNSCVWLEDWR